MKQKIDGRKAEELAAAYLTRQGIQMLEKNYRCRQGEIDLIGRDGDFLVFIEVKARGSLQCGYPGEAVTPAKQKKICQTALRYCCEQRINPEIPLRFDVVEIVNDRIRHTKNAFSYC